MDLFYFYTKEIKQIKKKVLNNIVIKNECNSKNLNSYNY